MFIKRFVLILFSLIFIVLILEGVVRKFIPQVTYSQAVKLSIDCYAFDPDMPFTLGKNFTCTMTNGSNEFYATARLNSLGYRGEEFTVEKKEGTKRILILGDSMTFGWGLPDDQTYPFKLSQILHAKGYENSEVINGGYVGGLSPDSFYLYLKDRGLQLKPDLVVVGLFVWNDISDFSETVWDKTDNDGLPVKISNCCHMVDGRIFRNKVIDFKYQIPIVRESHLFLLFINTLQRRFGMFPSGALLAPKSETILGCVMNSDCIYKFYPEEQKLQLVLKGMKKLTDSQNIPLLVLLLPVDVQLYKESWQKYSRFQMAWFPKAGDEEFIQKRIESNLTKLNISYLDVFSFFDTNRSRGYPFFPLDAHFNSIGTTLTSEALAKELTDHPDSYGLK